MPRRKKPQPDMTDQELYESLFPKKIRERVEREIELDVGSEAVENEDEKEDDEPIED